MKKYLEYLLFEIEILIILILHIGPAMISILLASYINPYYIFLILSYILLIPLYYVIWTSEKVKELIYDKEQEKPKWKESIK